jgi:hypothetical protein
MTGLIFLALGIASMMAVAGLRGTAIGLFGASFIAAVLWFDHHMTSSIELSF